MFTYWATPRAGFWGLVAGTLAALAHYIAYNRRWLPYGSDMSANFYGAACGWTVCFLVTCGVSLFTSRKPRAELAGLVYSPGDPATSSSPGRIRQAWLFAAVITVVLLILNWLFY